MLPYFGPPYEAAAFVPLSWLSYRHAYALFLAINAVLLMGVLLFLRAELSIKIPVWQPRPGFMLIPFLPLLIALGQGQLSIVLLLCCAGAWAMLRSDRLAAAGLLLSIAVFKFNLIVPIAVLLSARWGWRLLLSFAAGAAFWLLAPLRLCGSQAMLAARQLLERGSLVRGNVASPHSLGIFPQQMCSLWGLASALLPVRMVLSVTAMLSVVVVALCWFWIRGRSLTDAQAFAIAMLGGLVVSYHLYIHDLALILIPLALLHPTLRGREWMVTILYAVPPVLLAFFASPPFFLLDLIPLAMLVMMAVQRQEIN